MPGAAIRLSKSWGRIIEHDLKYTRCDYDAPSRRRTYENFGAQSRRHPGARHGAPAVPVILSTVASNLKDCAPFASLHKPALSGGGTMSRCGDVISRPALWRRQAGDYRAALKAFSQARRALDSEFAGIAFRPRALRPRSN